MKAEERTGTGVRIATSAMVALATLAIELAIVEPDRPSLAILASASGFLLAPMFVLTLWLGRRGRPVPDPVRSRDLAGIAEVAAIAFALVLPLAWRAILSARPGEGPPLEVVLMASLRNLGLVLGVLAYRPASARLAALASLFLAMIAQSMGDRPMVVLAVGACSVAGVLWLMFAYWERLSPSAADGSRARPPALAMVAWASAFAILVVVAASFVPSRAATILAGLVPSSGGSGENDPEARGGVNDGDNEVAASEDPKSTGFTESEIYLESDRPSLYDSFSELYGEPIKPKGKRERMVAMAPQDSETKQRPTENLQAGRTFATARQRPTRPPGRGAEHRAKALVYLKGETPLHIGLAAYDRFDGVTWEEEPPSGRNCPLELVTKDAAWLRLDWASPRLFGGRVSHQVKIGTLDSSTLPVPAHVTRLRVGGVNRPDFFGWAQDGLLRMVGRTVPAGTVIDTVSETLDPHRLGSIEFLPEGGPAPARYLAVPVSLDPGVAGLVRSWVGEVPRGWSQVEAVVAGVRGHCLHDRLAPVRGDDGDAVGHFMLRSRCGPDHQFASAAAVSLRLLGYPSRVVSGYYASPDRYDARTRHTPVLSEDVHFWAEVLLPSGTWAAVEPTPGYELMNPAPSLVERICGALRLVWDRVRSNVAAIASACFALSLMYASRRRILDGISTLSWWILARGPARERVLRTLRLLELRSSRAGLGRPPGRTPGGWYRAIAAGSPTGSRAELERLVAIASWASHAPEGSARPPWPESDIDSACRGAVRIWTLGRFRSRRLPLLIEVNP